MQIKDFFTALFRYLLIFLFGIGFITFSDEFVRIFHHLSEYENNTQKSIDFLLIRLIPIFSGIVLLMFFWKISPWVARRICSGFKTPDGEIDIARLFRLEHLVKFFGFYLIIKSIIILYRGFVLVFLKTQPYYFDDVVSYLFVYASISLFILVIGLLIIKYTHAIVKLLNR
jgi:hypothetical protein